MMEKTALPVERPAAGQKMTIEEVSRLPKDGYKYELIGGEVRMTPAGLQHERIGGDLYFEIRKYLEKQPIGHLYGSSAGYQLSSDDLLSPDISFVRLDRLPGGQDPEGYADFAPDLAVEIVSPNDRLTEIEEKVQLYLRHGTRLVWVINPRLRSATVYHPDGAARLLRADDALNGEDVLPGFTCPLAGIM